MQEIQNLEVLGRGVRYLQNIHKNFLHNAIEIIERNHPSFAAVFAELQSA
jgi:hypothetical protein